MKLPTPTALPDKEFQIIFKSSNMFIENNFMEQKRALPDPIRALLSYR